ncbi:hypothetical protein [Paenibacillus rhizoplanae]|uniref:Type 4 fimbrial biogenesis protein PilX N-terminal domain-containing protein n=1 Tax=Paenibacillus rhizoplanae TaxID=1917181 RepID=A0ABW5F9Q4_9BACL
MPGAGPSLCQLGIERLKGFARRFREERGSALVLVMFIVLLLTILGLSVLTAAVGGAQRTETRKNDVQSLHLAEKTLDEAVAYITSSLNKRVAASVDMSQAEVDAAIKGFLSNLKSMNNPEETGNPSALFASTDLHQSDGGKAIGTIVDITEPITTEQGQSVSYTVTLTAQAEVNGVVRKLKQNVVVDTYPDFLKYTLGSENNLIINGSPYIKGNIYAGNRLEISDTAYYTYLDQRSFLSTPFELDGEAHVQSLDKLVYKAQDRKELTGNEVTEASIISADKVKIKSHRSFVEVNVKSSFIDKVQEAVGTGASRQSILDNMNNHSLAAYLTSNYEAIFDHTVLPPKPDPADTTEEGIQALEEYAKAVNILTNPKKSLVYAGDLTIDGTELTGINYTQKTSSAYPDAKHYWYIIDGNLTIDNYGGPTPIDIRANILVTGKVQIRGKVRFDSTIFALKESNVPNGGEDFTTVVEDAFIEGLNGKELVLMSQGQILINRLAAFDNTEPAPLAAFFYTDSDAQLYGVGSIFSLIGGFFAKGDLTINAVRGTALRGDSDINIQGNNSLIRFKAIYNDRIFTDQQAGLPRVKAVNIRVGDLRLE